VQGTETIKTRLGFSYYDGNDPQIRALVRAGERPTEFGHKVWASSWVLLDHLAARPIPLRGLRVLEVGCGWGLVGIYLAKVHACDVTCTDLDAHVLPIVRLQAELNGVAVETERASFADLSGEFLRGFDLIVGVEVCYCEEAGRDMVQLVDRAFSSGVQQILITDPGRPDFDDLLAHSAKHYHPSLTELPGSVNGKTTQLLLIQA
jgi:predicted nicotinamide N-methyase